MATKVLVVSLLFALCRFSHGQTTDKDDSVVRKTNFGLLKGRKTDYAQTFIGVPFAKPPARWESPEDPDTWTGVYDATKPKPMCYQQSNCADVNPVGTCLPEMSEDCLYLNIYAPLNSDAFSKKSVMVFLHGGGFEFSSGGAEVYNSEVIAAKGDVIVVTINYRLGAFGFMVTGSGQNDIRGNYGLQDQRQALLWVNQNIKHFGGDPKSVTLFGQSAGAISTAIHLTSGKADNLFKYVIIESSPFTIPLKPLVVAIEQCDKLARLLNCPPRDIQCLKAKSPGDIADAQGKFFSQAAYPDSFLRKFIPWIPNIDGEEVPMALVDAFASGRFVSKPAILGTVSEEGQMYVYLGFDKPIPTMQYRFLLMGVEPKQAIDAFKHYSPTNKTDARDVMATLTTDYVFACPTRAVARALSQRAPVYTYVFHNALSVEGAWNRLHHCDNRVCHGVEIPYVFQSARTEPYVFTPAEFQLSDSMIYYWTNFAKTGNPNQFGRLGVHFWPRYTVNGYFPEMSMVFNAGKGNYLTQGYKRNACDFWDNSDYKAKK